jgi:hypothetical protein
MRRPTALERRIDALAHRRLADAPASGMRAVCIEVGVFLLKQAWACIFGATLLLVIVGARLWYPDDAALARNDFLTISAIVIQIVMLATRLESGRELWVILLFHVTGRRRRSTSTSSPTTGSGTSAGCCWSQSSCCGRGR